MSDKSVKLKLCVKFLTLVACLLLLSSRENLAHYLSLTQQLAAVPVISVQSQPDAPLCISVLSYDSSDTRVPVITFQLTNVGNKLIRAYAVTQETLRGTEKSRGLILADMDSTNAILHLGQLTTESIVYPPLSERISQITLSVDFVEFTDGTTWGPNLSKSIETLTGRRAGVREANKHLLQLYKSGGVKAVIKHLEAGEVSLVLPPGHSPEWEESFRNGSGFTARRLKRILSNGGVEQVEAQLRRLVDKLAGGK